MIPFLLNRNYYYILSPKLRTSDIIFILKVGNFNMKFKLASSGAAASTA